MTPLTTSFICTLSWGFLLFLFLPKLLIPSSVMIWVIMLRSQQRKATKLRGEKTPKWFGQSSEGLGGCLGWFWHESFRTGQDGHSQAPACGYSRGLIPWGSDFRDCSIPWSWGNLRIPLPSLLLYLLGVSLLYFVPLDHFGSHLSDKPFCSEMTPL